MSVYLSKDDKYSGFKGFLELSGDFNSVNSSIVVSEGRIVSVENGYCFLVAAKSITDLYKPENFKPDMLISIPIHKSQYTRWTKDNPKVPVEQTVLEKTLITWIESEDGSQWLDKNFSCKLHLNGSEQICNVVAANKMWNLLIDELVEVEPNLIKDVQAGSGSGYKRASQSESERLSQRQQWLLSVVGSFGDDKPTDIFQAALILTALEKEMPDTYPLAMECIRLVLG